MLIPFHQRLVPRPFENTNGRNGPWTLKEIFSTYKNNAGCGNNNKGLDGVFDLKITYDELLKLSKEKVTGSLFRNHVASKEEIIKYGLLRSAGASDEYPQNIIDMLKHTSRSGGSEGKVLSLSSRAHIAKKFSRHNSVLVEINTNKADNPNLYKNLATLIMENADNFLKRGVVKAPVIINALKGIKEFGEYEVFYLDGDIPHSHVENIYQK